MAKAEGKERIKETKKKQLCIIHMNLFGYNVYNYICLILKKKQEIYLKFSLHTIIPGCPPPPPGNVWISGRRPIYYRPYKYT